MKPEKGKHREKLASIVAVKERAREIFTQSDKVVQLKKKIEELQEQFRLSSSKKCVTHCHVCTCVCSVEYAVYGCIIVVLCGHFFLLWYVFGVHNDYLEYKEKLKHEKAFFCSWSNFFVVYFYRFYCALYRDILHGYTSLYYLIPPSRLHALLSFLWDKETSR